MAEQTLDPDRRLSRQEASAAVHELGWRYVLGVLRTRVTAGSLDRAAEITGAVVAAVGPDADEHLWLDVCHDQVILSLQTLGQATVTARDVDLARQISAAMTERGLRTGPDTDGYMAGSVQILEIAIDALDIPAVRPFWKAVLAYSDESGATGPNAPLIDPTRQGPAIWFQQMDAPRPQRNRIHIDVSVPHDEAQRRIASALAAGGTLVSDAAAPAFWVLADSEGNEACVTTWQGRDG